MKSLIIIWLLVLITLVGGGLYVNNALGNMLVEVNTSVLTPRTSLEVQNSNPSTLQPSQSVYEDETRPAWTIQPTMLDNDLQHMKHYAFLQDVAPQMMLQPTYNVSLAEDVTISNGVQPLVVQGSVYNVQGLRF